MAINSHEGLAIAQLAVFVPAAVLSVFIILRHGFKRNLGWIYLTLLSVIRIVGAIFEIVAVNNPNDTSAIIGAAILSSIGLAPLLMASMGLLTRFVDETSTRMPNTGGGAGSTIRDKLATRGGILARILGRFDAVSYRNRIIRVLQLVSTIGLVICIVGGTDESSSDASTVTDGKDLFKAGIVMFLVIYLVLLVLVGLSVGGLRRAATDPRRVLYAILLAMPFIAVRLLWSLLSVFANTDTFNIHGGNIYTEAFMATLEEFIVVIIYLVLGFMVERKNTPTQTRGAQANSQPDMQRPQAQHKDATWSQESYQVDLERAH